VSEVVHFTESEGHGGAEQALLDLLAGLRETRWAPVLAHHPRAERLAARAAALGVPTWPVAPMPHGAAGLRRLPAFARALRRRDPAVFHAHLTYPLAAKQALLGALAARRPAVVATLQLHMDVPVTRGMALQQRLIGAAVDRILPVSVHNAHAVHELLGWPLRRMEVIRNAVDAPALRREPDRALRRELAGEAPLVLCVARLDRQKGHADLLRAAAELPGVALVLAGDGPEREALDALAAELGVRARFLGVRDDVPELLAIADVMVLPSHYEGLPISVLEAMAVGTPVVATAIGGTTEAVEHQRTGLLVPPGEPTALAAALRRLLDDREEAARLAAAARAVVERDFSRAAMVRRVVDVYELVAGDG
jgi:glycosyltransferase involved in cell wall biosynthesis